MDKKDMPDEVLEYIKKETERIGYGKVVVEINKRLNFIDVISERRKRFSKEEKNNPEGMTPGLRDG